MPDITIKVPDGEFSGYLAKPASGKGPGILVIQEIFGVNKDMRDHCDNFAAQGYVALCPDIFWRQEPGVQITDQSEEIGRASCRERVCHTCRSRWLPSH